MVTSSISTASEFHLPEDVAFSGGFVGQNTGSNVNITDSYVLNSSSIAIGPFTFSAGFVGSNFEGAKVSDSYASDIFGLARATENSPAVNLGGFVGRNLGAHITNSYVTNSSLLIQGTASIEFTLGAFSGYNSNYTEYDSNYISNYGRIFNSYATNSSLTMITPDFSVTSYIGGFVGVSEATLTSSYVDSGITVQRNGNLILDDSGDPYSASSW